jgi:hypothetical protein
VHSFYSGLLVKSAAWLVAVGATLVAFSCDPDLSLEQALAGKRCGPEQSCSDGYFCNANGMCVAGAGGTAADAGGTTVTGAGGTPVTDAGGAGGSEAIGDGMDTMGSDVPDAADATPNCLPMPLFRDLDGDGFGSGEAVLRCLADGWVSQGQDCLDDPADNVSAKVHPGQRDFFAEGYSRPDQPGVISFDYDCSDSEDADPDNPVRVRAGDCGLTDPINCGVASGVATNTREGDGVDDRCGGVVVLCEQLSTEQCMGRERTNDVFRCR